MRAAEFVTKDLELRHEPTSTGGVEVHAYRDGKEVGWVRFQKLKTGQVKAAMVHVPERLRRQGIGSAMYSYARDELGLDIVPSDNQTDLGRAFWNKLHEGRKKRRRRNRSFGGYWYPGYGYYGSGYSGSSEGGDSGGDGGGGESVTEDMFNGIELSIETIKDDEYVDDDDYNNQVLYVKATSGGRELGHVLFAFDGEYLLPQDLEVDERFQGQGIAATMYDYVKSKGYKIRRSGQQTDAGAGFWNKHRPEQNVWENAEYSDRVIFIGNDTAIVGQEHGKRLQLSDSDAERIQAIAQRHGAWYEGNGMDRELTKGIIDDYKGSWDDDLLSPAIKGYPAPFLYVLFSNIKENDTVEGKIGFDPDSTIFDRILDTQPSTNYFPDREFDAETLQKFLQSVSEGPYDFVEMSQAPATESNVRKFFTMGERLMFPDNWEEYPYRAGRVAKSVNDLRDKFLATRKQGVYVAGSDHLQAVQQFLDQNKQDVAENFADGRVKGKSRPGRVKRAGASCAGSVTSLRQKAKNTGGERAKMYHWCANMKSGRKK